MVSVLASAFILGIAIAVLVGPVFFLLLNTALKKGFFQALYVALGVAISDILYILFVSLGFSQFENKYLSSDNLAKGGGILLIIFGLIMIFKKPKITQSLELTFNKSDKLKYFSKGFLLNFINPSVIIFWIGAVSSASIQLNGNKWLLFLFFSTTVITVFISDLLKIYLARKLSNLITEKTLYIINLISGFLLILYGIYLVW